MDSKQTRRVGGPMSTPLFMWAGGKRRLIPVYHPLLPRPDTITAYVEPFLGGGAVFAHLQRIGIPASGRYILGDANTELMQLFGQVRDAPGVLLEALQPYESVWAEADIAQRKAVYYRWRQQYWTMPNLSLQEQQASSALLLMLMKTSFNGIWQTCQQSGGRFGTPVGLARQKGPVVNPDTLMAWSHMLASACLHSGGYQDIEVPEGAFVYCDPPYRDSFTRYGTGWTDTDLGHLIDWCRQQARERHCLVWMSNRMTVPDDGYFQRRASDATVTHMEVTYTAGRRKRTDNGFAAKAATEALLSWDGRNASA